MDTCVLFDQLCNNRINAYTHIIPIPSCIYTHRSISISMYLYQATCVVFNFIKCMYTKLFVQTSIYIILYLFMPSYIRRFISIHIYLYLVVTRVDLYHFISIYTKLYLHTSIYINLYVCIPVYMRRFISVCIYLYQVVFTHIDLYQFICIYTKLHASIYISLYLFKQRRAHYPILT